VKEKHIDLEEQIERCRRLRKYLTDKEMRDSLDELAKEYKARLKRRNDGGGRSFMLSDGR
jgi:hypothetical protein